MITRITLLDNAIRQPLSLRCDAVWRVNGKERLSHVGKNCLEAQKRQQHDVLRVPLLRRSPPKADSAAERTPDALRPL
jgi:hypothetical protein